MTNNDGEYKPAISIGISVMNNLLVRVIFDASITHLRQHSTVKDNLHQEITLNNQMKLPTKEKPHTTPFQRWHRGFTIKLCVLGCLSIG